jgi:hypothetical protein
VPGSTKRKTSLGQSSSSPSKGKLGTVGHTDGPSGQYPKPPRGLEPRDPAKARYARYLWLRYQITPEQREQMWLIQRGLCSICFKARKLNVDHDHKTGRVRGLLCYVCNHRVLGRGLEVPELHDRAAYYLRSTFDGRKLGQGEVNA